MLGGIIDVVSGQGPDQFKLNMLCRQVVEQPSSLPEQHRHDVQFQFVELPGSEQRCLATGRRGTWWVNTKTGTPS
jgi:hypothetical protein